VLDIEQLRSLRLGTYTVRDGYGAVVPVAWPICRLMLIGFPSQHHYTERDLALYALGVGCSAEKVSTSWSAIWLQLHSWDLTLLVSNFLLQLKCGAITCSALLSSLCFC
jgi:hypothetical protein